MILVCTGTEANRHEEVRWLGLEYSTAFCWYCATEGKTLASGMPAMKISDKFAKPLT